VDVLGFEFIEAANGQEALDLLEQEKGRVDLILLDWHMPVINGMEVIIRLKNDSVSSPSPLPW